jgi:HlyD family secretion protein
MSDTSFSASPQKSRAPAIFVVCFLFALLLVAAWFLMIPRAVIVRGEIEATQVDLAIKVIGRLQDKKVRIGDRIRRGDLLLTLINPDLEAKLVQAMAASNIAEVEMQKLLVGTRAEDIQQQLKAWKRAKAISEQARRNFDRAKQAQAGGSIQLGQTIESLQRADTSEQAAAASYEKAVGGNRQEEKDVAIARAAQAKAVVLELQENLKELNVIAPIDGEVAQINIDRGELASPGAALITIVDLTDIWVTANLREDLLARFRMGESFKGKVPALGDKEVEFKITSISPLGDFARVVNASGDFDLKTFEVRAVATRPVEGLRPGMSVLFQVPR